MTGNWGPGGRRAAVSITFDHLGEAADLEYGRWPTRRPVGQHHSVTHDLPRILEVLDGTRAAFFIESWNVAVYPDAIASVADAGHEVGAHGMRHEVWAALTPHQELDHLRRCRDEFERYGVQLRGLRPPGGIATPASAAIVNELELEYISPIDVPWGVLGNGVAVVTCGLGTTDVLYYGPKFTSYRRYKPGPETLAPADLIDGMLAAVDDAVRAGGYVSLTWHPFYQHVDGRTDPERLEAIAEVARSVRGNEHVWCATPSEVANWMRQRPDEYPGPESLDPPSYWNPSFYVDIKR